MAHAFFDFPQGLHTILTIRPLPGCTTAPLKIIRLPSALPTVKFFPQTVQAFSIIRASQKVHQTKMHSVPPFRYGKFSKIQRTLHYQT